MEVLYVLVPFAIAFAGAALVAYVWAVRSGQLDDLKTPAHRMLLDGERDRRAPD
jgi:cbb3-type cytochrome oxidase maturation protein